MAWDANSDPWEPDGLDEFDTNGPYWGDPDDHGDAWVIAERRWLLRKWYGGVIVDDSPDIIIPSD
jgi:hypothetical protein